MKSTTAILTLASILGILTVPAGSLPAARGAEGPDRMVLAYDGFDGEFGLDWEVLHPDFSHWSFSRHPGTLTVTTQDGAFTGSRTNYKNLFLIECPAAPREDFEATTCVAIKPMDEFNQGGLILYNDDDHFIYFVYEWGSGPVLGMGLGMGRKGLRQFTLLAETNQKQTFAYFHADQDLERVWLKITKHGSRYAASISVDGKTFAFLNSPLFDPYRVFDGGLAWGDGAVKHVGLFAGNSRWDNDPPEIEASFDSFEVKVLTESRNAEQQRHPRERTQTKPQQPLESLHRAIVAGNSARVKSVLAEGADFNARDSQGATAMHWAAKEGNNDIVGLLLGMGASATGPVDICNWTPLHLAAMEGRNDIVQLLISRGVPIDQQGLKGRLPFHLAVLGGHTETAALLLQHGANVNDRDGEGRTALHYAAIQGRDDMVRLLLAQRAEPTVMDDKGRTPLSIARQKDRSEIAAMLLQQGATQ